MWLGAKRPSSRCVVALDQKGRLFFIVVAVLVGERREHGVLLADAVAEAREMQATIDAFIKPLLRLSKASLDAFIAQSRAHRSGPTYQHRRELERQSLLESWPQEEHWQAVEKFLARKQS